MKKIGKVLGYIICAIPFFALWCGILAFSYAATTISGSHLLRDAYGVWFARGVMLIGILAFLSIIYLPFLIRSKIKAQIFAYVITVLFVCFVWVCAGEGEKKFSDFTAEKWQEYPARRVSMYNDLVDRYELDGWTEDEVIALLGNPDEKDEESNQVYYVYSATQENDIYVKFIDGKVEDFYMIT